MARLSCASAAQGTALAVRQLLHHQVQVLRLLPEARKRESAYGHVLGGVQIRLRFRLDGLVRRFPILKWRATAMRRGGAAMRLRP